MSQSDDDDVQLSAESLAALQEFYEERDKLKEISDVSANVRFDEDWQLSQFWYDETTVDTFVEGILTKTGPTAKIALISCPTLYNKLKAGAENREVTLFEYDRRFAVFGSDFVFYDYKSSLDIPKHLANQFDLVVADPPFLSEECLTKTAVSIKFLAKKDILLSTGAVMSELATRLLGVEKCNFEPRHKNNLANEFWCYSNFEFDAAIRTNKDIISNYTCNCYLSRTFCSSLIPFVISKILELDCEFVKSIRLSWRRKFSDLRDKLFIFHRSIKYTFRNYSLSALSFVRYIEITACSISDMPRFIYTRFQTS